MPLVTPAEPADQRARINEVTDGPKPSRIERSLGASFNIPRYFAAAVAKLVRLRRDPFATGRPVCPLRRVESALTMLFTSKKLVCNLGITRLSLARPAAAKTA